MTHGAACPAWSYFRGHTVVSRHSECIECQTLWSRFPCSSCPWWTSAWAVMGVEKCLISLAWSYLGGFKKNEKETKVGGGSQPSPAEAVLGNGIPTPGSTHSHIPGLALRFRGRQESWADEMLHLTQHWPSLLVSARAFEEHNAVWLSFLAASVCLYNYFVALKKPSQGCLDDNTPNP